MIHYLEYFKLLKPPTSKFVDKLIYFSLILLTAILVIPISMLKKKTIKEAIFIIFPKLMPKDLLVNFHGVKFIARKGKTDILLLNELSEPWMTKYFKPKKGEIVVDVGAHVGKYALVAAKMVGKNGRVIAIEAHPENFKALLKNIRLNGFNNIIALNVAAFNEDGKELELFGSMDDRYSLKLSEGPKIKVKTITIDSILRKYGIEKVDLVKIDVEGAEVEVLEGMRKIIENSQNLKILVEVHSENRRKWMISLEDLRVRIWGEMTQMFLLYFTGEKGQHECRRIFQELLKLHNFKIVEVKNSCVQSSENVRFKRVIKAG